MARSRYKGPYVDVQLLEQLEKSDPKKPIKTRSRRSMIIAQMDRRTIAVHNGKEYVPLYINAEDMVGLRLGEFAPTRTFRGHSGDKKVKDK